MFARNDQREIDAPLFISDYLVDADVLLLRLDHPHALFAHLVHYAKYVDRVHVRYLKGEQNGLFKTDLKYISRIILDFENVAVARRKMREEKEHIIQHSAESSSLLMMSPPPAFNCLLKIMVAGVFTTHQAVSQLL